MNNQIRTSRSLFGRVALAVVLMACTDVAQAAPTLVNGSMTGTTGAATAAPGWSIANSTPDLVDGTGPFNFTGMDWVLSPDGGTFARLNATEDPNFREAIEQTVDGFEVGVAYSFDFYVTNLGFYQVAADDWRHQSAFIELYVDDVLVGQSGTIVGPATKNDPIQWSAVEIGFVASSTSHTIRLEASPTETLAYLGVDGAALVLGGVTTTTSVPTTSTTSSSTSTSTSSVPSSSTTSTSVTSSSTTTSLSSSTTTTSTPSSSTTSSSTSTSTSVVSSSSTSTSTSSSTSTTVPPDCLPGDCDDGDACTTDTCDPLVGCIATPLPDWAGVVCRLDGLVASDVCGAEPIDPKLLAFVGKRITRALGAVGRAIEATNARKVRKQTRSVGKQLKKIGRRVAKFERKDRITPECAAAFRALLCQLVSETDIPDLQQSPCPF